MCNGTDGAMILHINPPAKIDPIATVVELELNEK